MVFLTFVIAATGVIGIILVIQGSADSNRLADAAEKQAYAAKSFASSADKINTGIENAVDKLNLQAGAANRLAGDTEKANDNAASTDRRWIGIALQAEALEVGKIPNVHIFATNAGRRPAKITWMVAAGNLFTEFPEEPSYASTKGEKSTFILVPNSPVNMDYGITGEPLTEQTMWIINARTQTLLEYAKVEYTDVRTGKSYFTHACWRYIPAFGTMKSGFYDCAEYNEAK
jgi:hypothetical protein